MSTPTHTVLIVLPLPRTRFCRCSWQGADSPDDLQRKLLSASFVRNTDRTAGNMRSSRSHAIFVTQARLRWGWGGGWGGVGGGGRCLC